MTMKYYLAITSRVIASYFSIILLKAVLCKTVDPVISARVWNGQMWKHHKNNKRKFNFG